MSIGSKDENGFCFSYSRSALLMFAKREPVKEGKQLDTPFEKAERALWFAVKTLGEYEPNLSKTEKERLLKVKQELNRHFSQI